MFLRFFIIFIFFIFHISFLFSAELKIYVNFVNQLPYDIKFNVDKVKFISIQNESLTFEVNKEISSLFSKFNQQFLKDIKISEGIYDKLVISISNTLIERNNINIENSNIEIPINLKIVGDEAIAIFLEMDIKNSIKKNKFSPIFHLKKQNIPLRGEILFITSSSNNLLYTIRIDTNQITAVMKISEKPKELSLSCSEDKVYILTKKNRSIYIIEVSTFRLIDNFILPFVIKPDQLKLLAKDKLLVVDSEFNKIIIINPMSGSLINQLNIGDFLSDIQYYRKTNKIFLSSYNDQIVYVLDESLNINQKIKTEGSPKSLYIYNDYLYISNFDSGIISIYDINSNTKVRDIHIDSPGDIIGYNDRIFICDQENETIDILYSNQNEVVKEIEMPGVPSKLGICLKRGWLYVLLENKKQIVVVDILKEKIIGLIDLGDIPFDLKVGRDYIIDNCIQ